MQLTITNMVTQNLKLPRIISRSPLPRLNLGNISPNKIHPAWVAAHIFDDNGKRQALDTLLKGPTQKYGGH